jgi:hypothetical protein
MIVDSIGSALFTQIVLGEEGKCLHDARTV